MANEEHFIDIDMGVRVSHIVEMIWQQLTGDVSLADTSQSERVNVTSLCRCHCLEGFFVARCDVRSL